MANLKTASVLAFERNLDISDAVFTQYDSVTESQSTVVAVRPKSVRGTISNRLKTTLASDPVKLDAEIQKANLQKVDVAMLDSNNNMLKVNFTCKMIPFDGKPNICNNQDYQLRIEDVVHQYLQEHGINELARRYATNILNARWLWRNRIGSESVAVTVRCKIDGEEQVAKLSNSRTMSLQQFDHKSETLDKVSSWISNGLCGNYFVMMNVEAKAHVGYGQEVYPSQELVLDTGKTKSKELYVVNEKTGQAGMHSQKISNAIRTIDTWYSDAPKMPIPIEPYGAVTTMGTAFRPSKMSFYSIWDQWILKDKKPDTEQQHYVMAVLLRGGVFGESGKG